MVLLASCNLDPFHLDFSNLEWQALDPLSQEVGMLDRESLGTSAISRLFLSSQNRTYGLTQYAHLVQHKAVVVLRRFTILRLLIRHDHLPFDLCQSVGSLLRFCFQ